MFLQCSRILLTLLVWISMCFLAANDSVGQSPALLTGFWSTRNVSKSTLITSGLPTAKVFAITALQIPPGRRPSNTAFLIYTDGSITPLPFMLSEGSTVYIEARTIAIKQSVDDPNDGGSIAQGTWNVVQENTIPAVEYSLIKLDHDRPHLVAAFASPQDFVITLTADGECYGAMMQITVDSRTVINPLTGAVADFPMGSSFHSSGRIAGMNITGGACSIGGGFNGNFKFRRDKP